MKEIKDSDKKLLSMPISPSQVKTTPSALAVRVPSRREGFGRAIAPLRFPEDDTSNKWERLLVQAQRINQMAAQLEAMMLEFKTIASKLQEQGKPYNSICQYLPVSVPLVVQKPDEPFILTMRKVDIFQAEKEAVQLAQQLRQQSRSKE